MSLSVAAFYFVKDAVLCVTLQKQRTIEKALQANDSAIHKSFKAHGRQRPMKSYFQQGFQKKWARNEDRKQEGLLATLKLVEPAPGHDLQRTVLGLVHERIWVHVCLLRKGVKNTIEAP